MADETTPAAGALPDWRTMWDFQDPAATEERFRAAIAAGEAAGDAEYVAVVTTQVARTHGLRKRFDAAHEILDTVEPRLDGLPPEVRVRYLLERGRTLHSGGRKDECVGRFEEAWEVARDAGLDGLAVDAAHMLAIALPGRQSLAWSERAMALCESSADPRVRGWLGPLYNNTGWTTFEMGDVEKALALWEKGVAFREQEGVPRAIGIARYTVARAWRALGRHEDALAASHAVREYQRASDLPEDGFVAEEIAENLAALGRDDEAAAWFATAWTLLRAQQPWLETHEPERWARLRERGGG